MNITEFKVEIYIPEDHVNEMRHQLNELGALKAGNYDHVLSLTKVTGYWRPLASAQPHCGRIGEISCEPECKMELRCSADLIRELLEKIYELHPYEEPVINILPLMSFQM